MLEKILEIIKDQLGLENVTPDTIALNASAIDSVELVMRLEEELDIDIPDEKAEKMKTVKDIIDYIKTQKPEAFSEEPEALEVTVKVVPREDKIWMCPHCQNEIGEKELFHDIKTGKDYHRPCQDKGPIILPKKKEEEK